MFFCFLFFPGKGFLFCMAACQSLKRSERNSPTVCGLHCLTSRM
ncbi:hypothetical protein cypCar_00003961 [Cyprinus carpio]|nr:hypothetical protein cypCar_00003961 [Cyprinus carpio]